MKNRQAIGHICLIVFSLILLKSCQSHSPPAGLTVQVQRVVSGQTLDVLLPGTPPVIERVRLIGIDAPDLQQQPWGKESQAGLEEILASNTQPLILDSVLLESDVEEIDQYGRRLAYVWRNGILVNEQLVKNGYALAVPRSPNYKYTQRFHRAQEYARILGHGIWNPQQPLRITPAEFRSQ